MALLKFLVTALTLGVEALAAVYGTITAGLERHLGGAAAAVADYFIHLTIAGVAGAAALGSATVGTASRAAAGLVLKALFGEEGLLRAREYEFSATLAAGQGFVLIHDGFPPKFIIYPNLCALPSLPWIPSIGFFWALNEEERAECIPGWANIAHYSTFTIFCTPPAHIFLTLGAKKVNHLS